MNCKKCLERVGHHGDVKDIREAEWLLHAPDGKAVPGCYYCGACAGAIVEEYGIKLGEKWFGVRIDEFGHAIPEVLAEKKT